MFDALFQQALKELPDFILGYDSFAHRDPDDLAWLVLLQIDLWHEGEDSEIKTVKQLNQCIDYVETWIDDKNVPIPSIS